MSLLLSEYWTHFGTDVAITAIAAIGLYVCFIAGQFSLGHAALLGAGAYAAGLISTKTGLPYWVGLVVAVLAGCAVSVLMGALLALRLREFYLAIGTLAFNFAAVVVVNNSKDLGGTSGLFGVRLRTTANLTLLLLAVVAVVVWQLERTRLGRAMRAIHDDETMAAANGVRIWRVKLATFAISGAITGLAGGLYAHFLGLARPDSFGFAQSTELWVPVIVGGSTLVGGPIVGAFVVGIVPEVINRRLQVDPLIISGALLILVALFRPSGAIRKGDLRRIRERLGRAPSPLELDPMIDPVDAAALRGEDADVDAEEAGASGGTQPVPQRGAVG